MVDLIPGINSTQILREAISDTLQSVPYMWGILQTAGIVFIIYVIFLIIKSLMALKVSLRVKHIEAKLDLLLEKSGIDYLLEIKNKKELLRKNKNKKANKKVSPKKGKKLKNKNKK